jgi:hypothetical protein
MKKGITAENTCLRLLLGLVFALSAPTAQALLVDLDPGSVGDSIVASTFPLPELNGIEANGQELLVDIVFADTKLIKSNCCDAGFIPDITLFVNWSGEVDSVTSMNISGSGLSNENGELIPGVDMSFRRGWSLDPPINFFQMVLSADEVIFHDLHFALTLPSADSLATVQSASLRLRSRGGSLEVGEGVAVPEPSTIALLSLGFAGLALTRSKMKA